LGIGAGILLALCLCSGAGYFAFTQFSSRTTIPEAPAIQVPTPIGGETVTENPTTPPVVAGDETPTPAAAPTVTIQADAPENAGNIDIPRLGGVPTLDGNLGEWGDVPAVESRYQVYNVAGWDGTNDLEASWQLGWDNTNLYIAVTVIDNIHVQTKWGAESFKGDSLEMQIDTDRAGDLGSGLSSDDFQLVLSAGNLANSNPILPNVTRFQGNGNGQIPETPGHNIQVAAQKTSNGYTLEAVIPWSDLDIAPRPDLVIGLSLNANDNDSPNTAIQEVMKSHVPTRTFRDPTTWGTMTLR
jgi:hypothetical protein